MVSAAAAAPDLPYCPLLSTAALLASWLHAAAHCVLHHAGCCCLLLLLMGVLAAGCCCRGGLAAAHAGCCVCGAAADLLGAAVSVEAHYRFAQRINGSSSSSTSANMQQHNLATDMHPSMKLLTENTHAHVQPWSQHAALCRVRSC